jgi:hypothetical protein
MDVREIGWGDMDWIDLVLIGTSGGLLWTRWWTFGFHKILGSCWVAAHLAASQEVLSSMSRLWLGFWQSWNCLQCSCSCQYNCSETSIKINLRSARKVTKRRFENGTFRVRSKWQPPHQDIHWKV